MRANLARDWKWPRRRRHRGDMRLGAVFGCTQLRAGIVLPAFHASRAARAQTQKLMDFLPVLSRHAADIVVAPRRGAVLDGDFGGLGLAAGDGAGERDGQAALLMAGGEAVARARGGGADGFFCLRGRNAGRRGNCGRAGRSRGALRRRVRRRPGDAGQRGNAALQANATLNRSDTDAFRNYEALNRVLLAFAQDDDPHVGAGFQFAEQLAEGGRFTRHDLAVDLEDQVVHFQPGLRGGRIGLDLHDHHAVLLRQAELIDEDGAGGFGTDAELAADSMAAAYSGHMASGRHARLLQSLLHFNADLLGIDLDRPFEKLAGFLDVGVALGLVPAGHRVEAELERTARLAGLLERLEHFLELLFLEDAVLLELLQRLADGLEIRRIHDDGLAFRREELPLDLLLGGVALLLFDFNAHLPLGGVAFLAVDALNDDVAEFLLGAGGDDDDLDAAVVGDLGLPGGDDDDVVGFGADADAGNAHSQGQQGTGGEHGPAPRAATLDTNRLLQ